MEAVTWSLLVLAKLLVYKRKLNTFHYMTGRVVVEKVGGKGPSKNKSKNTFFLFSSVYQSKSPVTFCILVFMETRI